MMFQSRLRSIAGNLKRSAFRCEYASRCAHYQKDSETCTNAVDKRHCGKFKNFLGLNYE